MDYSDIKDKLAWYQGLEWARKSSGVRNILFVDHLGRKRSDVAVFYLKKSPYWWDDVKSESVHLKIEDAKTQIRNQQFSSIWEKNGLSRKITSKFSSKLSHDLFDKESKLLTDETFDSSDLVLCFDRKLRDEVIKRFPKQKFKVFTFWGFISCKENTHQNDLSIESGNYLSPEEMIGEKGIMNSIKLVRKSTLRLEVIIDFLDDILSARDWVSHGNGANHRTHGV